MIKSTSIQRHLAIYAQKDAGQRGGLGRRAPNSMEKHESLPLSPLPQPHISHVPERASERESERERERESARAQERECERE